jgi:hypothetical protein
MTDLGNKEGMPPSLNPRLQKVLYITLEKGCCIFLEANDTTFQQLLSHGAEQTLSCNWHVIHILVVWNSQAKHLMGEMYDVYHFQSDLPMFSTLK